MTRTTRQLLLPAIAAALLSGCVTYGYRNGHGDYYYGQPTSEYAYPDGYYYGDYGYPGYYSAPYWGGSFGYYGYYGPRRPRHDGHDGHGHDGHDDGHGHGGDHGGGTPGNGGHPPSPPDRPRPPWRDLGNLPAEPGQRPGSRPRMTQPMQQAPQVRMAPRSVERVERPVPARASGNPKRDVRRNPVR